MLPPIFEDMFIKTSAVHNYSTRQAGWLYVKYAPTKRTQRNLRHYGTKLWNSLHNVVCSDCAISTFKQNLKVYLLSWYFVPFLVPFFTFCLNCHLPNCMHPAHYIAIIMHLAHSTLFQLTWQWWKCCLNELRAHKFYFCPLCQSWFFNMFFFLICLFWYECHVLYFEGLFLVQLWQ